MHSPLGHRPRGKLRHAIPRQGRARFVAQNGRQSSNDYHDVNLDDLAAGTANLQFGITHNVTLDINDRRLRSSLLPWTIGLDIQRSNLGGGVGMLVRESDIHLHRSVEIRPTRTPSAYRPLGSNASCGLTW